DALITCSPSIALGILTADCAPVLMADAKARVIAAVHAGWRGALEGVLEAALDAMCGQGAELKRLCACIGPCILQDSYEVGAEFRDRFLAASAHNDRFFRSSQAKTGHFHFDLPGYVDARLAKAGVGRIERTGGDTCAGRD